MPAPSPIEQLINQVGRLPGLGPRSARRVVLQLIKKPDTLMQPLITAMQGVMHNIVPCSTCGNLDSKDPCGICADARRDARTICVVEELSDLWAMERSHLYRGTYHVLGGVLSAMDQIGPEKLNVDTLVRRAASEEVEEVILATNATVDGQTTAHYLTERLKDANVKITRLAQGIPLGGELDYLDDGTLGAALKARLPF
jgi:recombination protein RecR